MFAKPALSALSPAWLTPTAPGPLIAASHGNAFGLGCWLRPPAFVGVSRHLQGEYP
ncbi:hypothetical protein LBMAG53_12730 [Planctomycetota bacterium]|nr:hypothetical protein LBMAG53_12730 [Planctomycetota bacterium]